MGAGLMTTPVRDSSCGKFGYWPPVVVYPAFASRMALKAAAKKTNIPAKNSSNITTNNAYSQMGAVAAVAPDRTYAGTKITARSMDESTKGPMPRLHSSADRPGKMTM